jgi:hypothetical protein
VDITDNEIINQHENKAEPTKAQHTVKDNEKLTGAEKMMHSAVGVAILALIAHVSLPFNLGVSVKDALAVPTVVEDTHTENICKDSSTR